MIEVVIIPPIGKPTVEQIEPNLENMQRVVGGYIEVLELPETSGDYIVVNEDGKSLVLADNPIATALYPATLPLKGTALVVGPDDGSGGFTSITPTLRDKIMVIYK